MTDPRSALPEHALGELLRQAARDEAPPAAVRARAIALDARSTRLGQQAAGLLRRLIAVALPDAAARSPFVPALGVRGGPGAGRQWLYHAPDCEIDVRVVARANERWSVVGQLFGELAAVRVVLEGAGSARSAEIDATREFVFLDVPSGAYSLAVQAGDVEVVVPHIEVG
ncbi:MAG: hypothetical protein IT516_17760 [Burkholderiales bacterium]|nr:hypothetical protein [Burkholderiales bacterium]